MTVRAAMDHLVGFKRHLRAEVSSGEGAYLFSERDVTMLKGAQIEALAALLDGSRTLAALLGAVPKGMAPGQVAALIAELADAGLVTARSPQVSGVDQRTVAYWEAAGVDAAAALAGTADKTVGLITVGRVDEAPALTALRSAGLTVLADPAGAADLSVVLCDDYLNPQLKEVNSLHRAANRPWLLAKPFGAKVWCGPVFEPAQPGCWHCLTVRLWGHRNAEACAQSALGPEGPAQRPAATIRPLVATAMNVIALEATKWLGGFRYPGQRGIWTFDSFDLTGEHHELPARPQCPVCGNPNLMRELARRPIVLQPRRKRSSVGGGHRSLEPAEGMARCP